MRDRPSFRYARHSTCFIATGRIMATNIQFEFAESLAASFVEYDDRLRRLRKGLSTEAVHDLRVASRHLMAALDSVHALLGSKKALRCRKRIKNRLQQLGSLRDIQVQLRAAQKQLGSGKTAENFIRNLQRQERELCRQNVAKIRGANAKNLRKAIAALHRRIAEPPTRTDSNRFLKTLNSIVDSDFETVVARLGALDSRDPRTFHRLRVRFKRFRYLLEFLRTIMSVPDDRVVRMKEYQDALGEIQDLSVLIKHLEDFVGPRKNGRQQDAELLVRRLMRRRAARIRAFVPTSGEVLDFWRPMPAKGRTSGESRAKARAG